VTSDRSAALLAELQAVCQRILATDPRVPTGSVPLTTMASVANGSAVANSLEALRRQCLDNYLQVAELKRSVDVHRGVVANDSATNGRMLVELSRSVENLVTAVDWDRTERQGQMGELIRSVESLRVGLAGFGAANRQQVSELRGTVESLEHTVGSLGEQVQGALDTLGGHIQTALTTLGEQIVLALQATREQIGQEMGHQATAYEALVSELDPNETRERLDELENLLSVGLPKFSADIQAGVQETLVAVSRTFELSEREHGNRMGELHRDFAATIRRLEAALQPRRREEPVGFDR
jgi:hypothetical protein